jgi:hypothetical protein
MSTTEDPTLGFRPDIDVDVVDSPMLQDYGAEAIVRYMRENYGVRVTIRGVTNHELRDVLTGFWATLDAADRADHIEELRHYDEMLRAPDAYPDRHLPIVSGAILAAKRAMESEP